MTDGNEDYTVEGDEANRILLAIGQQARDVMVFPPTQCSIIVTDSASIMLEFLRTPNSALDATVVYLNFEQARVFQKFLNDELGSMTERELVSTMEVPTKERTEDDLEA